jgi:epoxyqueuosine reductase
VCVALGNLKDPSTIPALTRALEDEEPLIRGHAAWALGRLGREGKQSLMKRWEVELEPWVREEIDLALKG